MSTAFSSSPFVKFKIFVLFFFPRAFLIWANDTLYILSIPCSLQQKGKERNGDVKWRREQMDVNVKSEIFVQNVQTWMKFVTSFPFSYPSKLSIFLLLFDPWNNKNGEM